MKNNIIRNFNKLIFVEMKKVVYKMKYVCMYVNFFLSYLFLIGRYVNNEQNLLYVQLVEINIL